MNNLAVRTLSGVGFAAIMLGGLLFSPYLYAGLFSVMTAGLMNEFFKMSMGEKFKTLRVLTIISGITLFGLTFACLKFGLEPRFLALAFIPLLLTIFAAIFSDDKRDMQPFSLLFGAYVYIAAPLSISVLAALPSGDFNGLLMICLFLLIWSSDIGSYALGMCFGQRPDSRKLCPDISPKKSWTGFWGGLVTAMLAGALLKFLGLLTFGYGHCIALGALVHVTGLLGDLFESLWKRTYGVKDSGNAIPGHGGLLDRFDSSLTALPAATLYLLVFNLL